MKLLMYEHASGGGLFGKPVSPSVFCEGFGMLRTMVADAKSSGNSITTILDKRIADFKPPLEADQIITVQSPEETETSLQQAAENADAVYVIAPETNHTLQKLVEKTERSNLLSLNSHSDAIAKASDKMLLQQHASAIGLSTPETITFSVEDNPENVIQAVSEKIGFPAVFKPVDGVGCEGLCVVNDEKRAKNAITKIVSKANTIFMVQQLIHGTAASVTLISNGKEARPITLNQQNLSLRAPSRESSYDGGTTPLNDEHELAAFTTAKKLVESIKGLKGYVGVDLVLTENEPVIIEVNPRLTTSYIGIRKVLQLNLAQAIINASLIHELPAKQETAGYAYFGKIKTPTPSNLALQRASKMPELVSPPFPALHEDCTCALACTEGSTPQQARYNFNKARKALNIIVLNGGKSER